MGSFKLKLVVYFALLALLPSSVAFYGFDQLARRSETRRVDARLQAGLRGALAAYGAELDRAQRKAEAVARGRTRRGTVELGRRGAIGASRSVPVVSHGRVLGTVVADVALDDRLLRRLGTAVDPVDVLVAVRDGRIVAGPHRGEIVRVGAGAPARVTVAGVRYRAVASTPLAEPRRVALVALAPQRVVDAAASAAERRAFLALCAALALFAAVTYLLGRSIVRTLRRLAEAANAITEGRLRERVDVRGRDEFAQLARSFNRMAADLEQRLVELEAERHRLRESTMRFGEALAATHDVEQLLRIVVETAVEATGAYGGAVLGPHGELARAGDPERGLQRLELPLTAGKQSFGRVVLTGPSFGTEEREVAASLVGHAVVALENARLHRIVERQALVDGLTGLANRRALEDTLHAEVARAERFQDDVCLVFADLDDFKAVNDRHGHPCGDLVLRAFAETLRETVREIDVAGRWGGEEFALVLPGTDAAGGAAVADRARVALAAADVRTPDGVAVSVTASFGVAAFPECPDAAALVAAADDALYRAKRDGKDRVVTAVSPATR